MDFVWATDSRTLSARLVTGEGLCRILLCIALVTAAPTITFPINSQVPPAARVSLPFAFTFSPSTFYSPLTLTYTLSNAPNWLSLDGSTRTLSGTAPESEADTAPIIQITANDKSGSVTMNTTLVVSRNRAPEVMIPLEDQISNFGAYSPPSSILYYPSSHFNISFDPETFGATKLNHYAVTQDNTPLPSWISFDGSSLTFVGTTPNSSSLVQPPQTFGLQLIASDILGFAGATIKFDIVVGTHKLEFKNEYLAVNATVGMAIDFTGLTGSLELDGEPANGSDIVLVNATTPSWLNFNNSTFALSGTPPMGAKSFNISVMVMDIYGDTANAIVSVRIMSPIFTGAIGLLNATIGASFSYTFKSFFSNVSDVIVSVDIDPSTQWLTFDTKALNLSGEVPADIRPSKVLVTVHATSRSSRAAESQTFMINFISAPPKATVATSTRTSTRTATATASISSTASSGSDSSKKLGPGQIAAIVIPIILAFFVTILFCFLYHRRRTLQSGRRNRVPEKKDISNPIREDEIESRDRLSSSHAYSNTTHSSIRHAEALQRHSQAMSTLGRNVSIRERDSQRTSGKRRRSYSETALSEFGPTWRHTQDSAYPPLRISGRRSSAARSSAARNTRNFSRKSSAPISYTTDRSSGDILSSPTSERTSKVSKLSIQNTPDFAYAESVSNKRTSRRTPNYLGVPNFGRRLSGLGHGSQNSIHGFSSIKKRQSSGVGHGTSRETYQIPASSLLGFTNSRLGAGGPDTKEQHRQSAMSALTESTEVLDSPKKMTLRQVPKSPNEAPSVWLPLGTGYSRSVSRRTEGSSPFFAGSSRSVSRGASRKSLKSMRDRYVSNTSPLGRSPPSNDGLGGSIIEGLSDVPATSSSEAPPSPTPDALDITYGSTHEGTRQLTSYVSQLSSPVSSPIHNSFQFSDSDSRFESAEPSPQSQQHGTFNNHEGHVQDEDCRSGFNSHVDASPRSFNGDWYGADESPQIAEAMGARATRPNIRASIQSPLRRNSVSRGRGTPRADGLERYVSSPGRTPNAHVQSIIRNTSLAASYLDQGRVGDDADEQAEMRSGSIHQAFL